MGSSGSKSLAARVIVRLPKNLKGIAKRMVKEGPGSAVKGKKIVSDYIDRALWGKQKR